MHLCIIFKKKALFNKSTNRILIKNRVSSIKSAFFFLLPLTCSVTYRGKGIVVIELARLVLRSTGDAVMLPTANT